MANIESWNDWFVQQRYEDVGIFPAALCGRRWNPSEHDQRAAWLLYTELRTRITTQPLHYLDGSEQATLDSLHQLFELVRELVKDKSLPEARHFSELTIYFLNKVVRPFTAKWHSQSLSGQLKNYDIKGEFRVELIALQARIRRFTVLIGALARGDDVLSEEAIADINEWQDEDQQEHWQDTETPVSQNALVYATIDQPANAATDAITNASVATLVQVIDSERQALLQRRGQASSDFNDIAGLAISGGGIRSATLALGVVQRLGKTGVLQQIDYLSTVSGGGYIGSLISRYLNESAEQKEKLADSPANKGVNVGLGRDDDPFGIDSEVSPVLQHLRNNSKYLLQDLLRPATQVLYGIAVQLLVVLSVVVMVALCAYGIDAMVDSTLKRFTSAYTGGWFFGVLAALSGVWAVLLVFLPVALTGLPERAAKWETATFVIGLATAALWLLYGAVTALDNVVLSARVIGYCGGLIVGLPVLMAITGLMLSGKPIGALLVRLAVLLFTLLLLAGTVAATLCLIANPEQIGEFLGSYPLGTFIAFAAMVVILLFLDVNKITLHRFYKNRLSRGYLIKRDTYLPIASKPADQKLSELRADPANPYHLINTTINGPRSDKSTSSQRRMDYFLFSEKYTGCDELGYYETTAMEAVNPDVTLGTAMAVSGAAVSPEMGDNSAGFAGKLLSLANIRMNFWLRKPDASGFFKHPGLIYLWREYRNSTTMDKDYVYLSDGGHIENLALFELLRRRCRFIIAIDGESDVMMTRSAINRVIRLARQDLQINLEIDTSRLALTEEHVSHAHFAFGTIRYPEGFVGHLLYFKSSMTGNEPADVLDYKRRNPTFPHQSTADQFFDEEQFEAYRALGYHMCEEIFANELVGSHRRGTDLRIDRLFSQLRRRLLR